MSDSTCRKVQVWKSDKQNSVLTACSRQRLWSTSMLHLLWSNAREEAGKLFFFQRTQITMRRFKCVNACLHIFLNSLCVFFCYSFLISYLSFCLIKALCCSVVMTTSLLECISFSRNVRFKRKEKQTQTRQAFMWSWPSIYSSWWRRKCEQRVRSEYKVVYVLLSLWVHWRLCLCLWLFVGMSLGMFCSNTVRV